MRARVMLYPRSAYKVMPWKNGSGSTTELLILPEGASVQTGFDWRISLAQVPASGPFSSFPGYHRTIMLLQGDPMELVHEDHGRHELKPLQPYAFHGSWTTSGILSGGPVQDFNVMVREGHGESEVEVQQGVKGTLFHSRSAAQQFIWCWSGAATIAVDGQRHHLSGQDALLISGSADLTTLVDSPTGIIISVGLQTHAG